MSSHEFLSGILQSVYEAYPNLLDTQVLKTVFPPLFLALIARNTNIIIHTPHPAELQKSTAKILSTIFGLQTKRVKVRSPQSQREILESFFISTSHGSPTPSAKRRPSRTSLPRSISAPRPPSSHFTEGSDTTAPPPSASRLPRHKTDPVLQITDIRPSYLPQVIVISNLERAGRAAHLALAEILRTRQIILNTGVWNLPDCFFVVYVCQIGDGYERPPIHITLLDHFAFSISLAAHIVPLPTSSPSPRMMPLPIPPQTRKSPLFPYDQLPLADTTYLSPIVSHYINALLTAARHHPELDGTIITARCVRDAEKIVRAAGFVFREDDGMTISGAHVRRVVPPILAHRLRVRDGPREQIMGVLWEGAGVMNWSKSPEKKPLSRRTIEAILADILTQV